MSQQGTTPPIAMPSPAPSGGFAAAVFRFLAPLATGLVLALVVVQALHTLGVIGDGYSS